MKQGKVISALLKSCLVEKSIDVENMLVGDRNALLIALRVSGYGAEYPVMVECPACEEKFKYTFSLASLPMKPLTVDPDTLGTNSFRFLLPISRKEVIFKLLTGADERDIQTSLDQAKKTLGLGAVEQGVTIRHVVSLNGVDDRQKLSNIIRSLPAGDSRALRTYVEKISPGIDMTQNVLCSACGEESEVGVPIGPEFFWPGG